MAHRVFLSYARADDHEEYTDPQKSFMRRLYNRLKAEGITVWWDRENMPSRALTFLQEIQEAITKAERVILVVGPNAIASDYVRAEWQYALSICRIVTPILRAGEYSLLPEILKNIHCVDCRTTRDEETAIAEIINDLQEPEQLLGTLIGVPELPPNYLSRSSDFTKVRQKVLADIETPTVVTGTTKRAGVQGMGGIGKTVLATAIARDCQVRRAFGDGIFWITLGQQPRLIQLQAQLGEWLGDNPRSFGNVEDGRRRLSSLLAERRSLLILDDVWEAEHAAAFDVLGERCKMLLTTRNVQLVRVSGAQGHMLDVLEPTLSVALLAQWASQPVSELPPDAAKVAAACGHLPLALAMIGASLGNRANRWERALHRLEMADLEKIKQDFPHYPYGDMLRAIEVSIEALPSEARARYFDFAVFPEDVDIPETAVKTFWKPEGLDEYETEDMIDLFYNRCLIRVNEDGSFRLHDLQLDYVQKRASNVRELHQRLLNAYNTDGRPWPTVPHDGYLYYHLAEHLLAVGQTKQLHELLTRSPAWLEAKFRECQGDSAFADDVNLALKRQLQETPEDNLIPLVQLYSLLQIISHRVGRYSDSMLSALVWLDRANEALSHVQLRDNPAARFEGLITIFQALHDRNGSHLDILIEIRNVIQAIIYPETRVVSLFKLVEALVHTGNQTEAMELLDEARLQIAHIPYTRSKISMLIQLAGYHKKWTDQEQSVQILDHATMLARKMESPEHRGAALRDLATALTQAGQAEEAHRLFTSSEDTVHSIKDASIRGAALRDLATALTQAGQAEEAHRLFTSSEDTVRSIEDASIRGAALRDLATALTQAGQAEEAHRLFTSSEDTVRSIKDASRRGYALRDLATALAQVKEWERAESMARSIEDVSSRGYALRDLANTLAQVKEWERAESMALSIKDVSSRGNALSDLATALAQAGQAEEAYRLFTSSENTVRSIEDESTRGYALHDLATALAQAKEWERAESVARSIEDASSRGNALRDLATALVDKGFLPYSLRVNVFQGLEIYLSYLLMANKYPQNFFSRSIDVSFNQILIAAMKIIAWEQPRWNRIAEILD